MQVRFAMVGVVAFASLACACAAHGPPGRGWPPPNGMQRPFPGPGGPSLFISPMGEPVRAASAGESALDMWFSSVDADRDGALSQAEFRTEALSFFSRLDANHDQAATSLESTAIYQHEAPEVLAAAMSGPPIMGGPGGRRGPPRGGPGGGGPGGPGGPGGGGPGGPGGGGPGGGGFPGGGPPGGEGGGRGGGPRARMIEPPQGAQLFGLLGDIEPVMSCDTDLSRRVTVDEFNACITARFRELDSNQDGFFQRAEARLWRERAGPPRR